MEAPAGDEVESVAGEIVDIFFPEVETPHLGDIFLAGVA